jgi:undecaprenyl-diphosphatase
MTWRTLLEMDQAISRQVRIAEKPGILRTLAVFFAHSGDSWFWLLGLFGLWYFGSNFWKQRSVVLVEAIVFLAIFVFIVKLLIRRKRPEGDWGGIYRITDPHSFPSGHAARAILITVIVIGLGPAWLAALLILWTPLVCLARVAMGVHYVSDVAAGVLLGLVVGLTSLFILPL